MRQSSNTNPARGRHHGGVHENNRAGRSITIDDTTALRRLQASRLARSLALLPDTAAALALLVFGGRA